MAEHLTMYWVSRNPCELNPCCLNCCLVFAAYWSKGGCEALLSACCLSLRGKPEWKGKYKRACSVYCNTRGSGLWCSPWKASLHLRKHLREISPVLLRETTHTFKIKNKYWIFPEIQQSIFWHGVFTKLLCNKLWILLFSDKWQSYKNTCNCYNQRITISSH